MKLPKVPASNTYVFATQTGQYVENDPDQRQLPLSEAGNVRKFEEPKKKASGE